MSRTERAWHAAVYAGMGLYYLVVGIGLVYVIAGLFKKAMKQ